MHSHRTLGAVALGAVVVSAVSFAVVDVSIANANGCIGARDACIDQAIPVVAVTFGALGILSLAVSIVPALQWFVRALQAVREEHDAIDGLDGLDGLDALREEDAVEAARQRILHQLTLDKVELREDGTR